MILLVALLLAEGRPLFYWGARPPVIVAEARGGAPEAAQVGEVHAALGPESLVVRFTFDRPVRTALYLTDGAPVSGRLRAVLYLDRDADPATGLGGPPTDLRTGAELRLDVGVLSLPADPEESRAARAVVTASLASLSPQGRRQRVWWADDSADPSFVSAHGEFVEVRLPLSRVGALGREARLVLVTDGGTWAGRLRP